MAGAETRSRSASSPAVIPGLVLDRSEQRHLAAGYAERVDLAPQLAGEPQQHRSQPARERDRIINYANH